MLEAQEIGIISKTSIHSRKYAGTFSAAMDVEGQVYACAGLIVGTRIPWMTGMHYVNEFNVLTKSQKGGFSFLHSIPMLWI